MLKLRRGVVGGVDPLVVRVRDEERPAWADRGIVGERREGDEVIVNVIARDLGLGSGGFDVVHVNLTRGLDAETDDDQHVIKLNYTSLQHPVNPVETSDPSDGWRLSPPGGDKAAKSMVVLVLALHGQLAPAAWAAAESEPGMRV